MENLKISDIHLNLNEFVDVTQNKLGIVLNKKSVIEFGFDYQILYKYLLENFDYYYKIGLLNYTNAEYKKLQMAITIFGVAKIVENSNIPETKKKFNFNTKEIKQNLLTYCQEYDVKPIWIKELFQSNPDEISEILCTYQKLLNTLTFCESTNIAEISLKFSNFCLSTDWGKNIIDVYKATQESFEIIFAYFETINIGEKLTEKNIVKDSIYVVTKELNGENLQFPSDYDFKPGTKLTIIKVNKPKFTVIAVDDIYGEKFAFDYDEFLDSTEISA